MLWKPSELTIAASFLFLIGSVMLPVDPAAAGESDAVCEDGEFCLFKDGDFRGCTVDTRYYDTSSGNLRDVSYVNCNSSASDSVSSYQNRTNAWLILWEHPDEKGFVYCVIPGGSGNVIRSFNDKASSVGIAHPRDFEGARVNCNFTDRD